VEEFRCPICLFGAILARRLIGVAEVVIPWRCACGRQVVLFSLCSGSQGEGFVAVLVVPSGVVLPWKVLLFAVLVILVLYPIPFVCKVVVACVAASA